MVEEGLGFEAVHVHGKFGSARDVREIEELPALELRAIGKISVLGERVVFPATGVVNGFAAPHAGRAVEIEESTAAGTRAMLNNEVAVEKNGFDIGQERVVAVEIRPARLHHADFATAIGIHEIRNRAAEKIRLGEKISIEDGDEFALRGFQAVFEGAGLVALAVGAMDISDRRALRGVALDAGASDFAGLVGGVVKDLHVKEFGRVVES